MTDAATYYAGRPWTVHEGDCRDALDAYPEEYFDAVVTDTPYGLSTVLDPPNLDRESLWRKIVAGLKEPPIRVLLRSWLDTGENPPLKGRGFMGHEWDVLVPPPNTWRAIWRVMKPGAYCLAAGGARTYDLIKVAMRLADFEADDDFCTWLQGQGMPKRVRIDLKIDQHFGKAGERPVIGQHANPSRNRPGDIAGIGGAEYVPLTGAATPEAARFVGWDRSRKPTWEPFIVAQKPLRGTIAENAMRYGTGGLHVDACRIPRGDAGQVQRVRGDTVDTDQIYGQYASRAGEPIVIDARGGYPTTVLLDEASAAALDAMSGQLVSGSRTSMVSTTSTIYGGGLGRGELPQLEGSRGGASRFFYVAKASTSERDKGLDALEVLTPGERSGREDGSAGINGYAGTRGEARNPHPCLKPTGLMGPLIEHALLLQDAVRQQVIQYVTRMGLPPGAWATDLNERPRVLDPFMGSGSTGVAAMQEGATFVGCEMMPEYADVARRRLQHAYMLPRDGASAGAGGDEAGDGASARTVSTSGQVGLFG